MPPTCAKHKPKDEPHLQQLGDGILRSHGATLQREYPFLRCGTVMTKPDRSHDALDVLIELKYVRETKDVRPITKDITEDIVRYGDNQKRVLFVIYDPKHIVTDEAALRELVERRPTMMIRCIR